MGTGTETVREGVYVEQRLTGYIDLTVSNPYRRVTEEIGGARFEVLYYYAMPGGMGIGYWDTHYETRTVPDWFLTPVVLKNGEFVGWGPEVMESVGLIEVPVVPDEDDSLLVGS